MGCVLCRRRQDDPRRGPSPWQRGVVVRPGGALEQVLVCPDCQADAAWTEVLARCEACGSTTVQVRLGEVACRSCGGSVIVAGSRPAPDPDAADRARLGDDVAAAIDRVLGRGAPPSA
jgi:hypothetical protein